MARSVTETAGSGKMIVVEVDYSTVVVMPYSPEAMEAAFYITGNAFTSRYDNEAKANRLVPKSAEIKIVDKASLVFGPEGAEQKPALVAVA